MRFRQLTNISLAMTALFAGAATAQDLRVVERPVFPPDCVALKARLTSEKSLGSISSETLLDSPRIQKALNTCAKGKAVELAPSPGHDAFLIGPISIPSGVTLRVDAGVTVYASRNPRDYDDNPAHTCGTLANHSNGCLPLIRSSYTFGSAIMGYGTIDGRGYMPLLIHGENAPISWWQLARQARTLHQNNPRLIDLSHTNHFTLYEIRLINAPTFHVAIGNSANLTIWGVKIITPYDARNTDGIDPGNSSNVTITDSHISDGDDQIAIGASHLPGSRHITVRDDWFGNGHGMSIGSYTEGGVDHLLAEHLIFDGSAQDHNATVVHIKTSANRGGIVKDLIYHDICARNVFYPIWLDPFYSGLATPGNRIPWYRSISISNLHSVTPDKVIIQGYNPSVPTEVSLSNVIVNHIHASDFVSKYHVTTPTNAIIHVGPGPINFLQHLRRPGVTVIGHATKDTPPYACPTQIFSPIMGEIIPGPSSIPTNFTPVIRVQILTTKAKAYASYQAELKTNPSATLAITPPTGTVTIYNGQLAVGRAKLIVNSNDGLESLSIPLKPLPSGVHTLTARYSGDAHYPPFKFGNYTLSVGRRVPPHTAIRTQAMPPHTRASRSIAPVRSVPEEK